MNEKRSGAWKKWLNDLSGKVNLAALRLLFAKQTDAEMRTALDWEINHR